MPEHYFTPQLLGPQVDQVRDALGNNQVGSHAFSLRSLRFQSVVQV